MIRRPQAHEDHSAALEGSLAPPSLSDDVEPARLGILAKLLGVTGVVVGCAVFALSFYSATQQLKQQEDSLKRRAEVYGKLVGEQARSAVAFEDRETAREVLRAVTLDRSVTGIAIFTDRGLLHEEGKLSRAAEVAGSRLLNRELFSLPDNYLVLQPIESLEGPKGRVVFELSKRDLAQSERRVIGASLLVGGLALLFAMALSWALSRSLVRRVQSIARATSAVATGDLAQQPIFDRARDEVGMLARGFNTMVRQLRELVDQIKRSARDEKERLETLVAARTVELDARNEELRLVMDNVDQGFLTIDREGVMSDERSACVARWFGEPQAGETFFEYMRVFAPEQSETFLLGWEQIKEGFLPLEVCLEQMPRRIVVKERTLSIELRPIVRETDDFDKALVIISDLTAIVERERAEEEERETVSLVSRLLRDRQGVIDFFEDTSALIVELKNAKADEGAFRRHVHTLKGNAGLFGLGSVVRACHVVETELEDTCKERLSSFGALLDSVQRITARFREFLGETDARLQVDESDRQQLLAAIERGASARQLRSIVESWRLERLEPRLVRAAEQLECLAKRLGKGPVEVDIDCQPIRQPHDDWQALWSELAHVIRNAVDHGLESPEERRLAGKPEVAKVSLRGYETDGQLVIEVEDSGRGIDWKAVENKARALGLLAARDPSPEELQQVLFSAGLSTRDAVTDVSGRGVGLAAVQKTVSEHGGKIDVCSQLGQGTCFRVTWPFSTATVGPFSKAELTSVS